MSSTELGHQSASHWTTAVHCRHSAHQQPHTARRAWPTPSGHQPAWAQGCPGQQGHLLSRSTLARGQQPRNQVGVKRLEGHSAILKQKHPEGGEEWAPRASPESKSSLISSPRHTTAGNCASAATQHLPLHGKVPSEKYSCKTFIVLLQASAPGLLRVLLGSEGRIFLHPLYTKVPQHNCFPQSNNGMRSP